MKVLLTGANGQLGQDFQKLFREEGIYCFATDSDTLDITNLAAVKEFVKTKNIDTIINCAAYNNVDKAESDWKTAYLVNGLAVKNLALAANEINASFVHFSTDYVFSGKKGTQYTIFDTPDPISKYGESKLFGERMALQTAKRGFVLRVSWVFGTGNTNFVKKTIEWSTGKTELKVVDDQISSPTYTVDLAKAAYDLLKTESYGLYNVTNSGYCSRYEWAEYILRKNGWEGKLIPVKSAEFNTPATRPEFSVLENFGFKETVGYDMPDWKDATDRFMEELKKQ